MRTKEDITKKIKEIRYWRDNANIEIPEWKQRHKQFCNGMIMALKFSLGYKIGTFYWCIRCCNYHRNIKCPRCGNDVVKELVRLEER